jgi:hypothetical protein
MLAEGGESFSRDEEFFSCAAVSVSGAMHRQIARTLLFALLAGMFSPLAAASSMSASHPHCMRKPTPAAAAEMSGCHHHHGVAAPKVSETTSPDQVQDPNDCCQDHECCRSMARPQWAHAAPGSNVGERRYAAQLAPPSHSQTRTSDFALDHPGRAPPVL